jgi:hypothetical protein
VAALDEWADGRGARIKAVYDTDQTDTTKLLAEIGDRPIDLVVDDASHKYAETLTSFNALFPRLRPGGAFVIEDWSHGVVPAAHPELTARLRALPPPPLASLIVEILLACATTAGLIERVEVHPELAIVWRGPLVAADLDVRAARWSELEIGLRHRDAASVAADEGVRSR